MTEIAILTLKLITAVGGAFILILSAIAAVQRLRTEKKKRLLLENEFSDRFLKQFNDREIASFLSGYVVPHCSPSDPANKEGEGFLADTRESIFDYMNRNLKHAAKSYHLLLADTGMGKTTFCLNYFAHVRKSFPSLNVCLVSLASGGATDIIRNIGNKSDTVLIADALDEDPKADRNGRSRLTEILEQAEDYRCVIITCRSQYFLSDDFIPRETPLAVLVPRSLGQSQTFSLIRSYISPFDQGEIDSYINKHFPRYYFWRLKARKRARELVSSIPDLAHRPMLLERLPDLAKSNSRSREVYDLYKLLVDGWIERESRWIESSLLQRVSLELAISMYRAFDSRHGRLRPEEIAEIAKTRVGDSPDWEKLTSRSLLNRDSQGNYKFAHKSILEFLVVEAAVQGHDSALEVNWTSFMKEVFISWGHSKSGQDQSERARAILRSDYGRANISPLFDLLGTSAVKGVPDFARCAERRRAPTGEKLPPSSWRTSSIDIDNKAGRGIIGITDAEYNLRWSYIPPVDNQDFKPVRLLDVLKFQAGYSGYRFPSYEQFVTLMEGLHQSGQHIIPDRKLFLLGDRPGKNEYLLVQANSDLTDKTYLRIVDKQRKIHGTSVYLNCYITGLKVAPTFITDCVVDQLYIQEDPSSLFDIPLQPMILS